MYCLHDFFDWVLPLSLEQMEKNVEQSQNDFTEYLYCLVLEKGGLLQNVCEGIFQL